MPRLHSTVAYCDECRDQIVAVAALTMCANHNCRKQICDDCAVATDDASLVACSHRCAAIATRDWREAA